MLADTAAGDRLDDAVIRLAEEQLSVGKRTVETGRVRVNRTTTTRVKKVDLALTSNTVEVRRVPVDKEVKTMPEVRETRTSIIVPVVEEVLVVERRLILREELHIRRVRSVERHTEQVTLRAQKATVARVAPEDSDDGPRPTARSERPSRRSAKQSAQPKKKRSSSERK
jgi:uncharacterized protein (TIGR02271 family)